MLDRRHLVALFQHMVGRRERAVGIAEAQLLVIIGLVIGEGVFGIDLIDHGRARLQRVLDIEHRRQRLIVDLDLCDGLIGFARAVGDDRDDGFALVTHLVDRERGLVVLAEIDQAEQCVQVARHVGGADHVPHALRPLGLAGIDAAESCVRMRAADHLQMQHALQLVVIEIGRGAGHMAEHVLALRALADLFQIVVALVGEDILAQFQHGTVPLRTRPAAGSG
ncbi:hypothetical protein AOQ73_12645 [Bradyrhizobium pachyrhizi]|nr:hypothetical protein AOQ73_12645 [Bradyrhizobium pachyrhizi]